MEETQEFYKIVVFGKIFSRNVLVMNWPLNVLLTLFTG